MRSSENKVFGELLGQFRTAKKLSQQKLADLMGKSRGTIINWESGTHLPKERAFVLELAKHLRLDSLQTDQLLEAALLDPLGTVWAIPFQRYPFFTGQEAILTKLAEMLRTDQSAALTQPPAITGLGGIGKTQIAVEYAWQYRSDYQYVLWSRADTRETLILGYIALAGALNLPEREEKDQMVTVQAVLHWLSAHTDWLLVLDNVEDVAILKDFLPPERLGHLLLTTRVQAIGPLAHPVEVQVMPPKVGATLLLRRAGYIAPDASLDIVSPAEAIIARTISEELGGLPLAIDQAGAYMEETQCNLIGYQERYRLYQSALLERRGRTSYDYPASVATTWALSFERITQQNQVAAELLRCCAFLHPDAIPEELFREGAAQLGPTLQEIGHNLLAFDEAVRVLRSYSLIQRDPRTTTLSIHRLVQAVLAGTMSIEAKQQWQTRVVGAIHATFPEDVRSALEKGARLLPHALRCIPWIKSTQPPTPAAVSLLHWTGVYLRERGQYKEAELLLGDALAFRERYLGSEHLDTAMSLNNLATLYARQGKNGQAEPLLRRALSIRERHLGPEHPDTTTSLNNLATLYWQQGKYELAEPLLRRALSIRERHLGPEHPDTAMSLNNLAALYWSQGKYELAEPLLQRALAIQEQCLGLEHLDTAASLNNLAEIYAQQSKYELAEPLLRRALAIWEQHLGPEHPDTASGVNTLAIIYRQQGKYELAESAFQRALAIRERMLEPIHHDLVETLFGFALLREAQGLHNEARSLYERALSARTQTLGAMHPETIETRSRLIALLHHMGRTEEAVSLEKEQDQSKHQSL